jgi:hypothetical protein
MTASMLQNIGSEFKSEPGTTVLTGFGGSAGGVAAQSATTFISEGTPHYRQ